MFLRELLFSFSSDKYPEVELLDHQLGSVQSLSRVQIFAAPWTEAHQASLSITIPELAQTQVHQVSDAIQLSHPLPSPSPPAPNLSQHHGLFQ